MLYDIFSILLDIEHILSINTVFTIKDLTPHMRNNTLMYIYKRLFDKLSTLLCFQIKVGLSLPTAKAVNAIGIPYRDRNKLGILLVGDIPWVVLRHF